MAPAIVQTQFRQMVHKVAEDHPLEVSPGRPEVLADDSAKRAICDAIVVLFRLDVPMLESQRRVAEAFQREPSVSPESVETTGQAEGCGADDDSGDLASDREASEVNTWG